MPSSAASKVWLVTGSSRGLGRDLVKALVAPGHRVAATARNPADVADLVAPSGGRAIALRLRSPGAAGSDARHPIRHS
jgi:NAD(P)-dependent dehydrogenase (short-subunit alcohol dehydrogenase family)